MWYVVTSDEVEGQHALPQLWYVVISDEFEGQHVLPQLISQLRWFPVDARPQPQSHQSPWQVLPVGTSLG